MDEKGEHAADEGKLTHGHGHGEAADAAARPAAQRRQVLDEVRGMPSHSKRLEKRAVLSKQGCAMPTDKRLAGIKIGAPQAAPAQSALLASPCLDNLRGVLQEWKVAELQRQGKPLPPSLISLPRTPPLSAASAPTSTLKPPPKRSSTVVDSTPENPFDFLDFDEPVARAAGSSRKG